MPKRLLTAIALFACSAGAHAQAAVTTGTLAGIVKDTLGNPLRDAEVTIQEVGRTAKTDTAGAFVLAQVPPGAHEVWIRRIGFIIVQFRWTSTANVRVETAITMRPLPHTLDAVTVYAMESKEMTSKSQVKGVVIDSTGFPVEGAEVQLIGTGRATVTAGDGSFIFRHVRPGQLMVRARQMGYAPATTNIKVGDDDQREIYLRMGNLAQMLDPVEIKERSGYGRIADALKDYDKRSRFRSEAMSVVVGPEKLGEMGATGLDWVARGFPGSFKRGPTSIISGNSTPIKYGGEAIEGDACVLENGYRAMSIPLRAYAAKDVEMIEYYPAPPPETEPTGTVLWRFTGVRGCDGEPGSHPAYYVIWLKGAK